jgi:hypothetical protein
VTVLSRDIDIFNNCYCERIKWKIELETDLDADRRRIFPSSHIATCQHSELHPHQQKPSKSRITTASAKPTHSHDPPSTALEMAL